MTVQAELNKDAQVVEYIVCVEGIGWPTDETDLSQGFDGDVFVTNDINGDLATVLGCTIHYGLQLPSSISDNFDPKTYAYKHGGLRFSVQDQDDFLLATFSPLSSSGHLACKLNAQLNYENDEVRIDNQWDTWSNGEIAWIAGREAVLLAGRVLVGGTVYRYPGSTREYLGTSRGRQDSRPTGLGAFGWAANTAIHNYNRYWFDRRVLLLMHVPGESVGNVMRIYNGQLRTYKSRQQGIVWDIATIHDMTGGINQIHESPSMSTIGPNDMQWSSQRATYPGESYAPYHFGALPGDYRRITVVNSDIDNYEWFANAFAYEYRNRVTGGTAGVVAAIFADATAPQAVQDGQGRYLIQAMIKIGDHYLRARHKRPDSPGAHTFDKWITQGSNYSVGNTFVQAFDIGTPLRYLLDNPKSGVSRFRFNRYATRHPIDTLLMFFTTMNNEFYIGDAAAGSTTTAINFTAPGWTVDEWVGYALHCVEANNKAMCRTILSNTATQITVDRAFSGGAVAVGDEFQIRNTLYDVLPIGWGLSIHNKKIDITSFEDVRDKFIGDLRLGYFAIGEREKINLWKVLVENICQPYGILLYIDRTTGKLTARHVGEITAQGGLIEDYVAVTAQNLLEVGDIDYTPHAPVGSIELMVRNQHIETIRPVYSEADANVAYAYGGGLEFAGEYADQKITEIGIAGQGRKVTIRSAELENAFPNGEMSSLKIKAMFNALGDSADLQARLVARFVRLAVPQPEVTIKLDISFLPQIQASALLSITDQTKFNPLNPYTAARGWNAMVARCLSTEIILSTTQPGVRTKVQLVQPTTGALVAPAVRALGKGNDAGGDYFVVHAPGTASEFTVDPDDLDWGLFRVDDLIEVRDVTGAFKEQEVIKGFGSNLATLPQDAADGRIYVDGAIVAAILVTDYVTFGLWSPANTANMNNFSAWADPNGTLGAGNDPAGRYL